MKKTVLVLGSTGAMGTYLVPKLAEDGYEVDAVSLDDVTSPYSNVHCLQGDAMKDRDFLFSLLNKGYDAIVDFMIYPKEFPDIAPRFLDSTDQYVYLSTYRVFDNKEHPITESSPQLLDSSDDEELKVSYDYCIFKARGEKWLRASGRKNWTILRPAITYSKRRCQLITLERWHLMPCWQQNTPVPLCAEAMGVQATMTWAGDVAEMQRRLIGNPQALGEDFNVTTAEHCTWQQVAEYYHDLFGLTWNLVDRDEYLTYRDGTVGLGAIRQLKYDRLFDRIMDNQKILTVTGMKQSDLTPLYEGLKRERETLRAD